MSARSEILGRIRAANGSRQAVATPARDYRHEHPIVDESALRALFIDRLRDYGVEVVEAGRSATQAEAGRLLRRMGGQSLLAPEGFPSEWIPPDLSVTLGVATLSAADLDGYDAVITTCSVAIAETGTIVLTSDRGQGHRAATTVPDIHVVIVEADQLVGGVPEAIARLHPDSTGRRPQTWISGPSATSDIELERVAGVHGPRRLGVVLLRATP